ncbi:MAG: YwiC-like family protein [Oscillochloridaceae bacterium]|nr:YwiC-like family protein [Chloroflexaceae bacterium]MDW8389653.1 YwiC-like family protein [Oscillochloridaceae bacterium]
MSTPTIRQPVRLRPIALPTEHGGWGLLGAPILLGLWVAPSVAGGWLSLAALGAFLARQPLKLAVGDWRRGRRFARTIWAERFIVLYGGTAFLSFLAAWFTAVAPFWPPIVLAAPLAAIQLRYDILKQSRALAAEMCGAVAISATVAAMVMAAGWEFRPALALWLLLALQATTAIVYVGARLRLARGEAARAWPAHVAHLLALVIVLALVWTGLAPRLSAVVFAALLARSLLGVLPCSLKTPTPLVGMQELGFSLLAVAGIALGLRLGW